MSAMRLSATELAMVLLDELVGQGVGDVVLSPGSRSAPLALAAATDDRLRLHVRIDERTAAFLALGLARGSGRPAVVLCSSGTATANYLPAVVEADAAGVPLIVLTADRPPELRGIGANQTIDQVGLYGRATRWAHEVGDTDPRYVRGVAAQAVRRATGPWPGPVHLNVPLREPLLDPDAGELAAIRQRVGGSALASARDRGPQHWRALPDPIATTTVPAAERLLGDRAALLVAGEGSTEQPDALTLAGRLGIPVLAEPTSGLRAVHDPVPADSAPLRCGHWLAATPAFVDRHVPDVVVVVGRPVLSRPIGGLIQRASTVVVCDPLDRGWDPFSTATHVISQTFQRWAADVPSRDQRAWVDRWRAADATASRVLDAHLDGNLSELGTARDLVTALPDGAQLVVASSLAVRHLNETMRPRHGLRVLGNRGASGIDGFMSTAIGAALGFAGPTAALAGDLSVVHDLTGLVVGEDEPLPSLPVVVLHNNGGGIFDLLPYGRAVDPTVFRRVFATPHGLPFHAVALTLGHGWTHVDRPDELGHVLQDAWATPGITLIEVTSDTPAETARHRTIQQAVADALVGS